MKAFEIHLNGKKLCAAGTEGGILLFSVSCSKNPQGEVLQIAPRDSRKYEKAYVRRMAKQFGWT
jgi:hypothetical protein